MYMKIRIFIRLLENIHLFFKLMFKYTRFIYTRRNTYIYIYKCKEIGSVVVFVKDTIFYQKVAASSYYRFRQLQAYKSCEIIIHVEVVANRARVIKLFFIMIKPA